MVSTELEMVNEVRLEQPENVSFPMLVTEVGMVIEVSPRQQKNAISSISVTE